MTTGSDRLRSFLDCEEANGAGGDDTPVYDVVGYDLTYGDLRFTLKERDDLTAKLDAATRAVVALGGSCDRWRTAFETLADAVEAACSIDAGEALPESSPWAAELDRLDTALNEIRDELKAASR